jgi:hypothetical protein
MARQNEIDQMILAENLTESDVIRYIEATEWLSNEGSDQKLKIIPEQTQNKIAQLFKRLREIGIYPSSLKNNKLQWQEITTYQEGWYRKLKSNPNEYPYLSREDVNKSLESLGIKLNSLKLPKEFYKAKIADTYDGPCKTHQCKPCGHSQNCKTRANEWLKGIELIINKRLGTKGSEELINYMQKEYNGGL